MAIQRVRANYKFVRERELRARSGILQGRPLLGGRIVVDDGLTDETSAYLASVRDAAPVPVTVIADATSRGLAAAINQGLRAARGEYLVVLNNDVVVTDGWLGQLIALANAKGDFTADHAERAETKTEGEGEGRPAVDLGAGSGGPRTARTVRGR
jgi:glycosyltransferase involved in cell wall biosynthesis